MALHAIYRGATVLMMNLCTPNGLLIESQGPYPATWNDAKILNHMKNEQLFKDTFLPGDVFVLDAGFRDCAQSFRDDGYVVFINRTLPKNQKQVSALDANYNRKVAKVRWVV